MVSRIRAFAPWLLLLPLLALGAACGDTGESNAGAVVEPEPGQAAPADVDTAVTTAEEGAQEDSATTPDESTSDDGDPDRPAAGEEAVAKAEGVEDAAPTVVTGAPVPPLTVEPVQAEASQTPGGGRFPPLNDPRVVSAAAATWLHDDTPILGAVQNEDARAYPVFMMTFHHVANDVLGGEPYLVSF